MDLRRIIVFVITIPAFPDLSVDFMIYKILILKVTYF